MKYPLIFLVCIFDAKMEILWEFCRPFWTQPLMARSQLLHLLPAHLRALLQECSLGMLHAAGWNQNPSKYHLCCPYVQFLWKGELAPENKNGSPAAFPVPMTGESRTWCNLHLHCCSHIPRVCSALPSHKVLVLIPQAASSVIAPQVTS